jgi:hypothetical protein
MADVSEYYDVTSVPYRQGISCFVIFFQGKFDTMELTWQINLILCDAPPSDFI